MGGTNLPDPPQQELHVLAGTGFFRGVGAGDLAPLLHDARRSEYRRNQIIVDADEEPDTLFLVAGGLARLDRVSPDDTWLTVETVSPGDLHGAAHAAPGVEIRSRMTAVVRDTVVYRISAARLEAFLDARPELLKQALGIAYRRLGRAFTLAQALHQTPVPVRLARLLCAIAKTSPNQEIRETHAELAGLIGASREEVTRVLGDFRDRGLVEKLPGHRGYRVPDPERLAREIEAEYE